MSATDFSEAEGILHEMFQGFTKQLNDDLPPLYKMLKPNTDLVSGSKVKASIQLERPQGLSSRSTSGLVLPTAVPGVYKEIEIETGRMYGVLEFDSKMLKLNSADARTRYINYLENEMRGIKETLVEDIGRQIFGDGKGYLSTAGTTSDAVIVQLATTALMHRFIVGMYVDIIVTTTGVAITNGTARQISAVDITNKTITLSGSDKVTTDATHSVVRQGAYGAEMTGLGAIVSATSDIYGITTASYPRWQSYVKTSVGAWSVKALVKAALESRLRGGSYPNLIVSNGDLQGQYWYELTGSRTFDMASADARKSKVEIMGVGYTALDVTIDGKTCKWVSDRECESGVLYGLDTDYLGLQHVGEPEFLQEKDGSILISNAPGGSGTDTFKAVLAYYPQMVCKRRNAQFKMTGITAISGW